jgi:hypothetical protein
MQTLQNLLQNITNENPDATVVVPSDGIVTLETHILLIEDLDQSDNPVVPDGYRELMDVWHMLDVIQGLSKLLEDQNGRTPSNSDLYDRFMLFLATDA